MSKPSFIKSPMVSQQLVIDSPEPSKGFPVSYHEWANIKNKVNLLRKDKSFWDSFGWKDLGMVFLGVALTILVSLWLPGYPSFTIKVFAVILVIVLTVMGICCVIFQYKLDKQTSESNKIKAENIIDIMNLIEKNRSCLSESDN